VRRVNRAWLVLAASLLALAALFALGTWQREPLEARPALWQVTGPGGETAWLFGTIHAAPSPLAWQTEPVRAALESSDQIIVEVANLADEKAVSAAFQALSRTPGLPPVTQRVAPERRQALSTLLNDRGLDDAALRDVETWAVALTLARPSNPADARNGVDRAVIAAAGTRPVIELEGAPRQLAIFDGLPETEQRDLLEAVLADAGALAEGGTDLLDTWRKGDMARIEAETRTGLLADPELREALFTGRNRRWVARLEEELRRGRRPFVAVGAAHMAGPEGLPALLEAAGYTVKRLN